MSTFSMSPFSVNKRVIADEQVQLVDPRNRPCGSASRVTMRQLNCWHRATYIVVRNGKDEICVQERTSIKEKIGRASGRERV